MVVGGGDSALEAAASIAELGTCAVILSYRGEAFQRAKQRNRQRVQEASALGRPQGTDGFGHPGDPAAGRGTQTGRKVMAVANDAVIVSAGGVLPNDFLRAIGIEVETKYGTA